MSCTLDIPQIGFAPDWTRHWRAARFKRNDQMPEILPKGVMDSLAPASTAISPTKPECSVFRSGHSAASAASTARGDGPVSASASDEISASRKGVLTTAPQGRQPIIAVNRCGRIDSNMSLDAPGKARDSTRMTHHSYQLYCQRIDASRNMARYYALSIQPTLFGETAVMRSWGRIGKAGGEKSDIFSDKQQAISHFLTLARRKRKRGYVVVGDQSTSPV